MLQDQASVVLALINAAAASVEPQRQQRFEAAASEAIEFVLRELTSDEGSFVSSLHSVSAPTLSSTALEAEDGQFYIWTPAEVGQVLGAQIAQFDQYFELSEHGHLLQRQIPKPAAGDNYVASTTDLQEACTSHAADQTAAMVSALRVHRDATRQRPETNTLAVSGTNGQMVSTLCHAHSRGWDADGRWIAAAERAMRVVKSSLWDSGRLLHCNVAREHGSLQDHCCVAAGCIALYQTTDQTEWLQWAHDLLLTLNPIFQTADGTLAQV